jgi:predicted transcriptional regulator of viral defense system
MIEELRSSIDGEEFDYQTLLSGLRGYASPRDAITRLLHSGAIIRVKKGLYVFGPPYARRPYSRELLANLIYGPSYVSLDYALQHYGLIPEHVQAVTSATSSRAKRFLTPVGLFIYRPVPPSAYWMGMDRVETDGSVMALMATPEKALADKVRDDRGTGVNSVRRMHSYLLEDLRIDEEGLSRLDADEIDKIGEACRSRKIVLLAAAVRLLQGADAGQGR